jgi:hypothetical protein
MALSTPPAAPDAPPTTPVRGQRATFSPRMDAFLAWFSPFRTALAAFVTWYTDDAKPELEALQADVLAQQGTATTQAGIATTQASAASASAVAAAASALSAVNAPGASATYAGALTVQAGTISVTVQTGKAWLPGQPVNVAKTTDAAHVLMWGLLQTYNSGTGAIQIVIGAGDFKGAGSHSGWTISLGGQEGPPGADAVLTMPTLTVGATATLVAGNNGMRVLATTTSTLTTDTPSTLTDGWGVIIPAQTYQVTINGTFSDGTSSKVVYIGSGAMLCSNGTTLEFTPFGGALPYLHVRDEKAANTNGGAVTATAENERTLNTVKTNTITGASLGSNRVTLPAGTYRVAARAPANSAALHRLSLYNHTDSAIILAGPAGFNDSSYSNASDATVVGRFTLAASKLVRLNHYFQVNAGATAMGRPLNIGQTEVYAELEIWKEG